MIDYEDDETCLPLGGDRRYPKSVNPYSQYVRVWKRKKRQELKNIMALARENKAKKTQKYGCPS